MEIDQDTLNEMPDLGDEWRAQSQEVMLQSVEVLAARSLLRGHAVEDVTVVTCTAVMDWARGRTDLELHEFVAEAEAAIGVDARALAATGTPLRTCQNMIEQVSVAVECGLPVLGMLRAAALTCIQLIALNPKLAEYRQLT